MKKSIKAELISLAHKILQLRDTSDYIALSNQARELHEKLLILAYAEKLENSGKSTLSIKDLEDNSRLSPKSETSEITQGSTVPSKEKSDAHVPAKKSIKSPAEILAENQAHYEKVKGMDDDRHRPDGTKFNQDEPVHEPVIEKIKDMWPEMSPEAADIDKVIESIIPQTPEVGKNNSFEIGNEFGQMPVFEPKHTVIKEAEDRPQNLNEKLKKSTFKIGLNDKLSFIKHLFKGSSNDYNRVISQLETFENAEEARTFVTNLVKPDYNNWVGKEVQEERFMEILEGRYS